MLDIMVDLETMGLKTNSPIVAVGAIQFNPITGEQGDSYYRILDLQSSVDKGQQIDVQALYWWMNQSDAARGELLTTNKISVEHMCGTFQKWLYSLGNPRKFRLWGNGASFDNAMLRFLFELCKVEMPIPFWNDRDVRTVVGFYPSSMFMEWKRNNLRKGAHHTALADAKYQAEYVSYIMQELGVEEIY